MDVKLRSRAMILCTAGVFFHSSIDSILRLINLTSIYLRRHKQTKLHSALDFSAHSIHN